MHNNERENPPEQSQTGDDLRENPIRGKLPCGARYCHRCHEECGVIVNAYILRDMANESSAEDSWPEKNVFERIQKRAAKMENSAASMPSQWEQYCHLQTP